MIATLTPAVVLQLYSEIPNLPFSFRIRASLVSGAQSPRTIWQESTQRQQASPIGTVLCFPSSCPNFVSLFSNFTALDLIGTPTWPTTLLCLGSLFVIAHSRILLLLLLLLLLPPFAQLGVRLLPCLTHFPSFSETYFLSSNDNR